MKNYIRALKNYGKETVQVIKKDIRYKNLIKTGDLLGSIDFRLVERGDNIEIEFIMISYGKYVDEGTIYIRAREFFKENIKSQFEKWTPEFNKAIDTDINEELNSLFKK
jgi:hypothetical protein